MTHPMTPLDAVRAGASVVVLLALAGCGASTPLLGIAGQEQVDAGAESGTGRSGGSSSGQHGTFGYSSGTTIGYSTVGYSTAHASTARTSTVGYSTAHASGTIGYSSVGYSSAAAGCYPHALTAFAPTPDLPPSPTCTSTETTELGTCFTSTGDAGAAACDEALIGPSGVPDACYGCVLTPATGTAWGALIGIDAPTYVGSTTYTEVDTINLGACVAREDTSAGGQACAAALDELTECELASCLANCPIASGTDEAGMTALFGGGTAAEPGCMLDAQTTVCLTYVNMSNTACATETNDAGTGALDRCSALATEVESAAPSAAEATTYFATICGTGG
jgi:hypothetical protein